jgi:hypothetical protein
MAFYYPLFHKKESVMKSWKRATALVSVLVVCLLMAVGMAPAAQPVGTFEGTVFHGIGDQLGHHAVTTKFTDGGGTYRINDGTVGKLTYLAPYGEMYVYRWQDKNGDGWLFAKSLDKQRFTGYWCSNDSEQRYAWTGTKPPDMRAVVKR